MAEASSYKSVHMISSSNTSNKRSGRSPHSNNRSNSGLQVHELVQSLPMCGYGFKSPVKYSTSQSNPGKAYFNCSKFPNGYRFFWWIEKQLLHGGANVDSLVEELCDVRNYLAVCKEELCEILRTVWVKKLAGFAYGFVCGFLVALVAMMLLKM